MQIVLEDVDHVQLCIPPGAEAQARAFYEGVLGFAEVPKPESLLSHGGMWYHCGNVEVHIGIDPVTQRTKGHPAFEVHGLTQIRQHLENHGIKIKEEPLIPDRQRFSFTDPFGNKIEFLEYLST